MLDMTKKSDEIKKNTRLCGRKHGDNSKFRIMIKIIVRTCSLSIVHIRGSTEGINPYLVSKKHDLMVMVMVVIMITIMAIRIIPRAIAVVVDIIWAPAR